MSTQRYAYMCKSEETFQSPRETMRLNSFPSVTASVPLARQNITPPESVVPSADEDVMIFGELAVLHQYPVILKQ